MSVSRILTPRPWCCQHLGPPVELQEHLQHCFARNVDYRSPRFPQDPDELPHLISPSGWFTGYCFCNTGTSFVVPRWWNELPSTTRAGASLSTFKKLLKTQLFREHFLTNWLALRLVCNLQLQQLHFCTSFSFLFHFVIQYFLCKVLFIVTPGSNARSLIILFLVRHFGPKRLLNA